MSKKIVSPNKSRFIYTGLYMFALIALIITISLVLKEPNVTFQSKAAMQRSSFTSPRGTSFPDNIFSLLFGRKQKKEKPNPTSQNARVGKETTSVPCGSFCDTEEKTFETTIMYPKDDSGNIDKTNAPYPLIVFLHGAFAKGEYYLWAGELLASKGYIVALPDKNELLSMNYTEGMQAMQSAIAYMQTRNATSGDIYQNSIDANAIGIGGHSMGANTSLVLLGQSNPTYTIKAAVVMSPCDAESMTSMGGISIPQIGLSPNMPNFGKSIPDLSQMMSDIVTQLTNAIAAIQAPTMVQIGSLDGMCKPEGAFALYELIPDTKSYVEIEGGNHVLLMDTDAQSSNKIADLLDNKATISRAQQQSIAGTYMVAWFDHYLKQSQDALSILENGANDVPSTLSRFDYQK